MIAQRTPVILVVKWKTACEITTNPKNCPYHDGQGGEIQHKVGNLQRGTSTEVYREEINRAWRAGIT